MENAKAFGGAMDVASARGSGMLVGGSGDAAEVRAAIAWAAIPAVISFAMYLASTVILRQSPERAALARSLCYSAESMLRLGEVFFIVGLWRFAVCFACVGEEQPFPPRQTLLIRAMTAFIVISALVMLAIVLVTPVVNSISHPIALSA
ncbi:MAG: hypothetical protein IVW54_04875 [Candidatus Binataceae bacterium]|nr:hypothetical protein [Candidatus Binataceae bacterium]